MHRNESNWSLRLIRPNPHIYISSVQGVCVSMCVWHAGERRVLLVFQSIVSEVCRWVSLGLCVLSNNTALPQPICLCICDRFAHTLTALVFSSTCYLAHTHTHTRSPSTPSTHLSVSHTFCLPTSLCLSVCLHIEDSGKGAVQR